MKLQWNILVNEALDIAPYLILYIGIIIMILFIVLLISISLTIIVRIAERNIIKKYLSSIKGSEIRRLTMENKKLKADKANLLARNKLYMNTFSLLRNTIVKGENIL